MEPSLFYGTLPFIMDDMTEVEGGKGQLDTLGFSVLCDPADWRGQLAELGIQRDNPLPASYGYATMWCSSIAPAERSGKAIRIAVSCAGLMIWDDKMKVVLGGKERRISVGPNEPTPALLRDSEGELIYTDVRGRVVDEEGNWVLRPSFPAVEIGGSEASGPALSIGYGALDVSTTYFARVRPNTGQVGTVAVPPGVDIDEPNIDEIVGTYMYIRKNVPYGWILSSREVECLFESGRIDGGEGVSGSTGLFACKDQYSYVLRGEPA